MKEPVKKPRKTRRKSESKSIKQTERVELLQLGMNQEKFVERRVSVRRAQRAATSLDSSRNKCSRPSREQVQQSLERMDLVSVRVWRRTGKVRWNETSQTDEPVMKSVTLRGVSSQTPKNFRNCRKMGLPMICEGVAEKPGSFVRTHRHQSYVPCRCDSKVCESCCQRQGKRVRRRYSKPIKESLANPRRGYSLKLLTVTRAIGEDFDGFDFPVNCEDDRLDRGRNLYQGTFEAFRALVNYCFPKSKGCGVLAVLEPQTSLSPHIHAVVYGPYVPQEVLSCAWRALTGDSYIVDIRKIRNVSDALEYVFKYVSKPPTNLRNADDLAVYLAMTRGFRRLHSFGIWYNIGKVEHQHAVCPACSLPVSLDADYYYKHDGPFPITTFQLRGIPPLGGLPGFSP